MVFARRNAINRESAARRGLRVVRMVKSCDPRVRPWMLLRDDFDFGGLGEVIDRHHLSIVVERRDADDLPRADVDEFQGVQRTVVVADVERAGVGGLIGQAVSQCCWDALTNVCASASQYGGPTIEDAA